MLRKTKVVRNMISALQEAGYDVVYVGNKKGHHEVELSKDGRSRKARFACTPAQPEQATENMVKCMNRHWSQS